MVFSSLLFVFYFLPVFLGLYYIILKFGGRAASHFFLTAASYLFYGWANPAFVLLMFASTVIDYTCGLFISGQFQKGAWKQPVQALDPDGPRLKSQRIALIISILSNMTLLGFFKYFNFGIDSWNAVMTGLGVDAWRYDTFLRITLPLGISFYTFQSMSYSIDVYRGDAKAIRGFTDFSCYVAMFPQLVAGPIIRFQEVADQIFDRKHTLEKFSRGAAFFIMGLCKKVLLADPCGKIADECFAAASLGIIDAWTGIIGYSFQIYFDFSAYSDMAIGLGLMMGFVFPKNFDSPYHAKSITEFWRRWHLSLSTWLRDYLYIPLGGNRKGEGRTYVNLAMVMLFGGLWHGASWNFVIWGAIHGIMLGLERAQGKKSWYQNMPGFVGVGITYFVVLIAWVFFRATTLPDAVNYLSSMFGLGDRHPTNDLVGGQIRTTYHMLSLAVAAGITWFGIQTWDFTRVLTWPKTALITLLFFLGIGMLAATSFSPFIYFIF